MGRHGDGKTRGSREAGTGRNGERQKEHGKRIIRIKMFQVGNIGIGCKLRG